MIQKISHIGLGVKDLAGACSFFREKFGLVASEQESFGELIFSFISLGDTKLELLQSTDSEGTIAKFIRSKGEGIHHISFEVEDIQAELDHLKEEGVKLINEKPYRNAHNEQVAFVHPKSTYGILIELMQIKEK